MIRFTYALVERYEPLSPLAQTYSVVSRHESLKTALRAFDRKYAPTDAPRFRLLGLDRRGRPDGNGFMSIAAARACLGD